MDSKIIFFGLTFAAVVLEVLGDFFLKKWSMESKHLVLGIGLFVYFLGSVFWAVSLKYEFLSKAISVFTLLNLIVVVLIGTLYFKEDLSTTNKIGIALGVVSILLIEL